MEKTIIDPSEFYATRITYQFVCYSHNPTLEGSDTSNENQAKQEAHDHYQAHPEHDIDILINRRTRVSNNFRVK